MLALGLKAQKAAKKLIAASHSFAYHNDETIMDFVWLMLDDALKRDCHQKQILDAYEGFKDVAGLAKVAAVKEIATNDYSLSIPLYVAPAAGPDSTGQEADLEAVVGAWRAAATKSDLAITSTLRTLGAEVNK